MTIPSFPTDNLYKFMAIFGLLIFFLSFYIIAIDKEELQALETKLSLAMDNVEFQHKTLNKELTNYINEQELAYPILQNLNNEVNEILNTVKTDGGKLSHFDNSEILGRVEKIEYTHDKFNEKISIQNKIIKESEYKVKESEILKKRYILEWENLTNRYDRNIWVGWILFTFGLSLMVFGFRLWYTKHQIYLDAESQWKGEIFVELLKDAEAKKNVAQDEPPKFKVDDKNKSV